jgi:hypothetical protein
LGFGFELYLEIVDWKFSGADSVMELNFHKSISKKFQKQFSKYKRSGGRLGSVGGEENSHPVLERLFSTTFRGAHPRFAPRKRS